MNFKSMVWWAHWTKYLVEFIPRKSTNLCGQGRHHAHTLFTKCEMELWWFIHQLETCYVYFKCCEVGWLGRSQAFSEWSGDKWDLAETRLVTEEERDIPNRRRLPSMVGLLNLRSFPWRIYLFFKAFSGLNFVLKKIIASLFKPYSVVNS